MKRFMVAFAVLALAAFGRGLPCNNEGLIKAAQMVKMSGGAITEEAVKDSMLKEKACAFDVSEQGLQALRNAGVSDFLITMAQAKMGKKVDIFGSANAEPAEAQPAPQQAAEQIPQQTAAPSSGYVPEGALKPGEGIFVADRTSKLRVLSGETPLPESDMSMKNVWTTGLRKTKTHYVIDGETSEVTVSPDGLNVVARGPFTKLHLIRMKRDKGKRVAFSLQGRISQNERVIDEVKEVTVEKIEGGLKLVPNRPLEPGSYCVTVGASARSVTVFAFDVGTNQVSMR